MLDIVVDIRVGSPTFGQHDAVRLDDRDFRAVYCPRGSGTARSRSRTTRCCPTSAPPGTTRTGRRASSPTDPALALPVPAGALLSPRDTGAPTLAEAAEQGLLPTYEECREFYASLPVI